MRDAAGTYPYTSLYAFNLWSLVADFWVADDPYVATGGLLLVLGLAASCVVAVRRRGADRFLVAGALATMAFYFLPTRAHERYLFPAFVLLLPVVASRRELLAPYLTLALSFAVTLVFALTRYAGNQFSAPGWLEATLFARPGQILLALVMTGSAASRVRRDPRRGTSASAHAGAAARARADRAFGRSRDDGDFGRSRDDGDFVRSRDDGTPPVVAPQPRRLPAGLAPGHAPSRRDAVLASSSQSRCS